MISTLDEVAEVLGWCLAVTVPAPAPGAVPSAPTGVPALSPVRLVDPARKGWHLEADVSADRLEDTVRVLDERGFALDTITGVDWLAGGEMELVYDFFHPEAAWRVVLRARVPRERPEIPTISAIFAGANWHERETHEFFGIRFTGHPNLTPLLLPEDATYHPLRKDFPGAA